MPKRNPPRIVKSRRDGYVVRWTDAAGFSHQRKCRRRTARAREQERAEIEAEMTHTARVTLPDFWDMAAVAYLDHCSQGHQAKTATMIRRLRAAADAAGLPTYFTCDQITPELLLRVEAAEHARGNRPATVHSNLATLWALLEWGKQRGVIPANLTRPKRPKSKTSRQRQPKGRPLTLEEIERLKSTIPAVCKPTENAADFCRAVDAMRLIGFRLTEAWNFAWDPVHGAHYPTRIGPTPAIYFDDSQKSGKAETIPITAEAAAWLETLEHAGQWVCRTRGAKGWHKTPNRLGRVIAAAGKRAGIVTKRDAAGQVIKTASAHDLRRTFAAVLHQRLNVSELQVMTRHHDAATLLDYYAKAELGPLIAKLNAIGGESVGTATSRPTKTP